MEYRFCPLCASELVLLLKSDGKKVRPSCLRCDFVHYGNPKPCVGAVIIKHGKVLLVQRANEPYKHHWDFPGGFLESGEHPKEGLKRELAEELKIDIKIRRTLGIYPDTYGAGGVATLNIYYLCRIALGKISPNQNEIAAAQWFDLEELPSQLAFEHVELVVSDLRKLYDRKHPVLV
jgi:ADP-ribose pyrophosphatase YjhB (NUDIX family)